MDISVVIPLYNEAESLPELHAWIKRVMDENGYTYEIIFVNDGSTDESWDIIKGLTAQDPSVKGLKFRRNYGKSPVCFVALRKLRATWSSPWTPTFRIAPMKSPDCSR
jgi:glycosyltransferase involved in cell wall biosynthesis